jgi:hypothetical protein
MAAFAGDWVVGVPLWACVLAGAVMLGAASGRAPAGEPIEIGRDELLDRVCGGWVGQLIGNLHGLPHEMKYNDEPRAELPEFACALPEGARTDDDTDVEWTHIHYIDAEGKLKIPYERLREVWLANMGGGLWAANKAAYELMRKGAVPPATGQAPNNPHCLYNLSGQFCTEVYGIVSPGMPRSAAELGLHYAHVSVSGEPLQAAQFWPGMIATAHFHKGSMEELILKALEAADPNSALHHAVRDAMEYHRANPKDWKAARQLFHRKWLKEMGWNNNATPTNGGLVALALLYGEGDLHKSLQYAFALGYDADCNGATVGAVLGVRIGMEGLKKIPGFRLVDRYVNRTRPALPKEVKISEQAEQLLRVAEKVILAGGGRKVERDGKVVYRVVPQSPRVLEALPKDTTLKAPTTRPAQ